jgi:PIN domain nuclease of toxin-antitoxin system
VEAANPTLLRPFGTGLGTLPGRHAAEQPTDRILIAAAREFAATLVMRDRELLAYGEMGNVRVVGC